VKTFLTKHLDDCLIAAGCVVLLIATGLLHYIAALYLLGIMLIGGGVLAGYLSNISNR
jgi:hypothetical protein